MRAWWKFEVENYLGFKYIAFGYGSSAELALSNIEFEYPIKNSKCLGVSSWEEIR